MASTPRVALTARVRADLAEEVRAFVRDQAGRPLYLTLSSFAEEAFARHLAHVRHQLEQGQGPDESVGVIPGRNGRITSNP